MVMPCTCRVYVVHTLPLAFSYPDTVSPAVRVCEVYPRFRVLPPVMQLSVGLCALYSVVRSMPQARGIIEPGAASCHYTRRDFCTCVRIGARRSVISDMSLGRHTTTSAAVPNVASHLSWLTVVRLLFVFSSAKIRSPSRASTRSGNPASMPGVVQPPPAMRTVRVWCTSQPCHLARSTIHC